MVTSTKIIITFALIGLLAFENCNGFFRPLPSLLKNTLNKILEDQLERKFGMTITWPLTSTTAKTTASSPTTTTLMKNCNLKTFEDCTMKEWKKFIEHQLRHLRGISKYKICA